MILDSAGAAPMAGADVNAGTQAVVGWVENAKVGERGEYKTGMASQERMLAKVGEDADSREG